MKFKDFLKEDAKELMDRPSINHLAGQMTHIDTDPKHFKMVLDKLDEFYKFVSKKYKEDPNYEKLPYVAPESKHHENYRETVNFIKSKEKLHSYFNKLRSDLIKELDLKDSDVEVLSKKINQLYTDSVKRHLNVDEVEKHIRDLEKMYNIK